MLYKLSLKNISKSIKDYTIYFFTLILGVSIFYIFNSVESQTVLLNITSNTKHIIKLMTNTLSVVSVFVSFILGFLIIYASRFLIKRRKKEFGIYLTLGMSKRKISKILLLETLTIGIISLFIGLTLGIALSQFMSLLVANMFEADLTKFAFIFSKSAAIKTLIYFGIIFTIVMIFNTVSISKCKLIDLLQSAKKSENIKLKNPTLCIIIFILSCVDLSIAYYLVTSGISLLAEASYIFIPIIMGIIGTFFLFWSMSGLLLNIFKSLKKLYYKNLNSFIIRQISSRVNTTVVSMTIICLMLFVTICVLSSALSLKNSMTANLKELVPIDIEVKKFIMKEEAYIDDAQLKDRNIEVLETLNNLGFDTKKYLTDTVEIKLYDIEDITIKNTLGKYYEKVKENYPLLQYDSRENIISISDYNKIAKLYKKEELTLKENEYIFLADNDSWVTIRNEGLKLNTPIKIKDKEYYPKNKEIVKGFIDISPTRINTGVIILPDNILEDSMINSKILLANYNTKNKEEKKEIEKMISEISDSPYYKNTSLSIDTKIEIYESSIGLGAMATFIGIYLGIIFLISSAAILALKELTESSDNKERYKIIRSLGADESIIKKALYRQIGVFFAFPLLIAIIHSIFGIVFCNYILETFGNEKLLISIIMTSIFLIIIYGGYFQITYACSKNIIKE